MKVRPPSLLDHHIAVSVFTKIAIFVALYVMQYARYVTSNLPLSKWKRPHYSSSIWLYLGRCSFMLLQSNSIINPKTLGIVFAVVVVTCDIAQAVAEAVASGCFNNLASPWYQPYIFFSFFDFILIWIFHMTLYALTSFKQKIISALVHILGGLSLIC